MNVDAFPLSFQEKRTLSKNLITFNTTVTLRRGAGSREGLSTTPEFSRGVHLTVCCALYCKRLDSSARGRGCVTLANAPRPTVRNNKLFAVTVGVGASGHSAASLAHSTRMSCVGAKRRALGAAQAAGAGAARRGVGYFGVSGGGRAGRSEGTSRSRGLCAGGGGGSARGGRAWLLATRLRTGVRHRTCCGRRCACALSGVCTSAWCDDPTPCAGRRSPSATSSTAPTTSWCVRRPAACRAAPGRDGTRRAAASLLSARPQRGILDPRGTATQRPRAAFAGPRVASAGAPPTDVRRPRARCGLPGPRRAAPRSCRAHRVRAVHVARRTPTRPPSTVCAQQRPFSYFRLWRRLPTQNPSKRMGSEILFLPFFFKCWLPPCPSGSTAATAGARVPCARRCGHRRQAARASERPANGGPRRSFARARARGTEACENPIKAARAPPRRVPPKAPGCARVRHRGIQEKHAKLPSKWPARGREPRECDPRRTG